VRIVREAAHLGIAAPGASILLDHLDPIRNADAEAFGGHLNGSLGQLGAITAPFTGSIQRVTARHKKSVDIATQLLPRADRGT
jgi:hypothetical protein